MIFVDNISELQYYTAPPPPIPCYCEQIIYPTDMTLQGDFPPNAGTYGFQAFTMSVDGLITYEDVSANFESYLFTNPITGKYTFNARLKYFADSMCVHACYILHVIITMDTIEVFNKYTQRYCQNSCCDIARDIDIQQDLVGTGGGGTTTTVTPTGGKQTDCGEQLITLTTLGDCYDPFTGEYYGTPTNIISGSADWGLYKVTNMRGRIVQRPREIERTYSYNCTLQRVASKKIYLLEGYEYFPTWKMNELENQLHSKFIYVEGVPYEYSGGTPMVQVWNCAEIFKLKTTLEDCIIRKTLGCGVPCGTNNNFDGNMVMFVVPSDYTGGNVYNESGVLVATTYDEFLDYVRGLNGIYSLNDLNPVSGFGCDVYGAFSISGTAYLPGSFYFGSYTQSDRVYSAVLGSADEICGQVGTICAMPVIGSISIEEQICASPVLGTVSITEEVPTDISINGWNDWAIVDSDTFVTLSNGIVTMIVKVANSTIIEDPDNPGDPVFIFNQQIAVVGGSGRPAFQMIFDENNSSLDPGAFVIINTDGSIFYQGLTTTAGPVNVTVLFNVNYNV